MIHPIVIAKFAIGLPRSYVLLLETAMMVYLQTYKRPAYGGYWAPRCTFDWQEAAQPSTMEEIDKLIGLNRAWPLMQGTSSKKSVEKICCHCKTTESTEWFNADPTRPLIGLRCSPCQHFKRKYKGTQFRTPQMEKSRQRSAKGLHKCDCCTFDEPYKPYDNPALPGKSPHLYFWEETGEYLCDTCRKWRYKGYGVPRPLIPGSWLTDNDAVAKLDKPEAPKPRAATTQNSSRFCVACGTTDPGARGFQISKKHDKKTRCTKCNASMLRAINDRKQRLARPTKPGNPPQTGKPLKFNTEADIFEHYSRNELSNQTVASSSSGPVPDCST